MTDETPIIQPETTQPAPEPQRNANKPGRKTIIAATGLLIAGLILGLIGGYALQYPKLTQAQADYERVKTSYAEANGRVQDLNDTISRLREQVNDLEQQVESLTPTTETGPGVTIMGYEDTTVGGIATRDFTIRNDTDKTADLIGLSFRYLDSDGNTVEETAGVTSVVDPGKTGVISLRIGFNIEDHPNIANMQCTGGWMIVNGNHFNIEFTGDLLPV